jgi:hypothetical protein
MCRSYTCKPGTRRWPMCVFFALVDIAALYGYMIWTKLHADWLPTTTPQQGKRKKFLKTLGQELCIEVVRKRSAEVGPLLPMNIKTAMEAVLGRQLSGTEPVESPPEEAGGRCFLCLQGVAGQSSKRRKNSLNSRVRTRCCQCSRRVCKQHSQMTAMCRRCQDDGTADSD